MSTTWKPRISVDDLTIAVALLTFLRASDSSAENDAAIARVTDWLRGEIAEREERAQARAITKVTGVTMGKARAQLRASRREAGA